jgi:Uma2 family endonuclease
VLSAAGQRTEAFGRPPDHSQPIAADCLIAAEIVLADSITTDIRDKRAEYAAAGIPHYWIVRMSGNDAG